MERWEKERWENRPIEGEKSLAGCACKVTVYAPWTKFDGLLREYEREKQQERELDEWERTGEVVLPKYSYAYMVKVQDWVWTDPYAITAPEQVGESLHRLSPELAFWLPLFGPHLQPSGGKPSGLVGVSGHSA
tara:strand:- start:674 stop:1072 length:399 start_codon:yes stop_codon:yes gene_type:complete